MKAFKIVFKDGTELKNQSFEDIFKYKTENINDNSFTITEDTEEKEPKNEQKREDFIKTLTLAQINDINLGKKIVCHSKKIGFYLKVIESEEKEIRISTEEIKSKNIENCKRILKDFLIQEVEKSSGFEGLTKEDVYKIIKSW